MELPKIKVADFEGPFDLLLHLIKKNKMDIYNVEIYKVTNQYLEYLNTRKVMDLEITSEFIVVAATLIEIKSSKEYEEMSKFIDIKVAKAAFMGYGLYEKNIIDLDEAIKML